MGRRGETHDSLWLFDVFEAEEELAIEIAEIDGVEIDDVDLTEAGEQKTFEQFTAYPTGTDEKDTGLEGGENQNTLRNLDAIILSNEKRSYLSNAPGKRADGALQVSVARHDCGDHGGAWSKYVMGRTVTRGKRSRTASPISQENVEIRIEEGEEEKGGGGRKRRS